VRIEQLYPFPREQLAAELQKYGKATDVIWCQEEPQNQGAWYQIKHHVQACLAKGQALSYAGRSRSPSPAVGHFADHVEEQLRLVADALVNPPGDQIVAE
jgi:2-oxoglutarate dehydrogenase E1 component